VGFGGPLIAGREGGDQPPPEPVGGGDQPEQ
jgi:hypothetical protein